MQRRGSRMLFKGKRRGAAREPRARRLSAAIPSRCRRRHRCFCSHLPFGPIFILFFVFFKVGPLACAAESSVSSLSPPSLPAESEGRKKRRGGLAGCRAEQRR